MTLRRPPSPIAAINRQTIEAGTTLHRTHARAYRATQFNPCQGQPTRFSPFTDAAGVCVPTLYAATSRESAAFETIFHDIAPKAAFKTVRLDVITARSISRIAPTRDLCLGALFTPDLKARTSRHGGLRRRDLIDTPKSTYAQTALWAGAIHAAHPGLDGLVWKSRQCDPERCVILFEDRAAETDFEPLVCLNISADAALLLELRGFGRRAGIDIVS